MSLIKHRVVKYRVTNFVSGHKVVCRGANGYRATYYLLLDRLYALYEVRPDEIILAFIAEDVIEDNARVEIKDASDRDPLEVTYMQYIEEFVRKRKSVELVIHEGQVFWKSYEPIISVERVVINEPDLRERWEKKEMIHVRRKHSSEDFGDQWQQGKAYSPGR